MTARTGGSIYLKKRVIDNQDKIRIRHYQRIGNLNIWVVNGKFIRDWIYIDFTEGGNSEAYVWMPSNEIWLDTDVHPFEMRFVLLHELTEYNEMTLNKLDYEPAHQKANVQELKARRDPDLYSNLISQQIKRQEGLK